MVPVQEGLDLAEGAALAEARRGPGLKGRAPSLLWEAAATGPVGSTPPLRPECG